jgi:glycyl-tRNA synthetase beta subunit
MINQYNSLLEIFSEEIPAPLQDKILKTTNEKLETLLKNSHAAGWKTFISSHRLIIIVKSDLENEVLYKILCNILLAIQKTFTKTMQWPQSQIRWIRPIRNILFIHNDVIEYREFLSIKSSAKVIVDKSFLSEDLDGNNKIELYFKKLESKQIIYDHLQRKEYIKQEIAHFEKKYNIKSSVGEKLLQELIGITDTPFAIEAEIDSQFLKLPAQLIELVLVKNQKYLIFYNENNEISKKFLIIINAKQKQREYLLKILEGNLRVLSARLEDAAFYYQKDLKTTKDELYQSLCQMNFTSSVKYDEYLNFQFSIATSIAKDNIQLNEIENIVNFAKIDLASATVSEFPELQGVIGYYYCKFFGHNNYQINQIIKYQYAKFDYKLYQDPEKAALFCTIDRLSYILTMYKSGNQPTSSGDPYAVKAKVDDLIHALIATKAINQAKIFDIIDKEQNSAAIKELILKRFLAICKDFLKVKNISFENFSSIQDLFYNICIEYILSSCVQLQQLRIRLEKLSQLNIDCRYNQSENYQECAFGEQHLFEMTQKINSDEIINYLHAAIQEVAISDNKHNLINNKVIEFQELYDKKLSYYVLEVNKYIDKSVGALNNSESNHKRMSLIKYIKEKLICF